MLGDYSPPTAASVYGIDFGRSAAPAGRSELGSISAPSEVGARQESPFSPENPLVVFGLIAAVTFGLMAFSTSVRVGGTTASLAVGNTK